MSEILLNVRDCSFRYDNSDWHLHDVELSAAGSEIFGILGPNGSGKSTLLKIMSGILTPQQGRVLLGDNNIHSMSRTEIARKLAYLPQTIRSEFDFSVLQVVSMGRFAYTKNFGFLSGDDQKIIDQVMEQTETKQFSKRKLSELSGGERQRVFLASVLAQEPKVLLLDEPTTGLDIHHQISFFKLLKTLSSDKQMAVILVTHDINLASLFCDKLMILYNGAVKSTGDINEVISSEVLTEVYPGDIFISSHPVSGKPIILPMDTKEQR